MPDSQWDKVGKVLEEAWGLPPERRVPFVEKCVEEEAVRDEVLSLLNAEAEATDLFEDLASVMSSALDELQERGKGEPRRLRTSDPLALEGERAGRYVVEQHLGGGGMGVVYKARDPELGRTVALKFLPPYLAASAEADERFLREAKAASALDHRNIGTIYETGETEEGRRFIAMAYYEGETLKRKIERGPLPIEDALGYAEQIADALSRAHEAGIVHRDVKPANVMITESGEVKLVDFGLAQVADQTRLTDPGQRVGTVAYMSPEQVEGETVDERTDIWALGVVLYEMLAATRPFRGERKSGLLRAILLQEPAPVQSHRAETPPGLDAVVERCLQKDPQDRFPTAAELNGKLRRVQQRPDERVPPGTSHRGTSWPFLSRSRGRIVLAGAGLLAVGVILWLVSSTPESLTQKLSPASRPEPTRFGAVQDQQAMVVLPCATQEEDAVLCTGLMATLTDQLVELQDPLGLWVVPSDEVRMRGASTPTDARQFYSASLVLTGSVTHEEENVRVRLTLLDGLTGQQVSAEELDPPAANVTVLQREATAAVARMLDAEFTSDDRVRSVNGGTTVPRAYLAHLQGRGYLWWTDERETLSVAIDAFQRSVEEDPVYAQAHAGLCESYRRRYETDREGPWRAKAEQHCDRALTLNDQLVDAHKSRGLLLKDGGQYDEAVRAFQRARALRPGRADLYRELASTYVERGQSEQAESTYQQFVYRWPDYWVGYDNLGDFYERQGRFEAAATQFRQAVSAAPENVELYGELARSYIYLGDLTEARNIFEGLVEDYPNYEAYSNLGTIYFQDGRYADAARMYQNALDLKSDDYRLWGNLAAAHYWSGAREQAREYYERAARMAEEQRKQSPNRPVLVSRLAAYYAMLNRHDHARSLIEKALVLAPKSVTVAFLAAVTYEQLGERDEALEWIERALARGFPPSFIERQRGLRELRTDPRFQEIMSAQAPS